MPVRAIAAATFLLLVALIPAYAGQKNIARNSIARATLEVQTASRDLFARSDLIGARAHAERAVKLHPQDRDALFLLMEAASLQADTKTELDAALKICATPGAGDDRTGVASFRILDLAANTSQFRAIVPAIKSVLSRKNTCENNLRAALMSAAMDGLPGLEPERLAHESGLVVDWKIAGPFGRYSNLDFDRQWAPEEDGLRSAASGGRKVENVRPMDGTFHLPDYFDRRGVYYAGTSFSNAAAGKHILRVESPGTLRIWVDGALQLDKDDRYRESGEVLATELPLSAGRHQLLVKFIPSALPFRVAVLHAPNRAHIFRPTRAVSEIMEFAAAEHSYWSGNYEEAITRITRLRQQRASAPIDFLLSQIGQRRGSDSPEVQKFLTDAASLAPGAIAVKFAVASRAYGAGRIDEAIRELRAVLAAKSDFVPAQELASRIAVDNQWTVEAGKAFDVLTDLHPSCSNLHKAHDFYVSMYDFKRAVHVELQLGSCAPGALDLAQVLSAAGKHQEASDAVGAIVKQYPFDRAARELFVHELILGGETVRADVEAQYLSVIAPNSSDAEELARSTAMSSNASASLGKVGPQSEPFYAPFRRDGVALVSETAVHTNESGPAIRLLDQAVVRLNGDDSFDTYVHRITRIRNRAGIQQYGEIAIPSGASLLELRTIGADGTVSEPELEQNKQTISMPALVPGSAIDVEYVIHSDAQSIDRVPGQFSFSFGSFQMPILNSSFAFIRLMGDNRVRPVLAPDVPTADVIDVRGENIKLWQAYDIKTAKRESNVVPGAGLPAVTLVSSPAPDWRGIQLAYGDALVDNIRVGPNVSAVAESFAHTFEDEAARDIYRYIQDNVKNDGGSFVTADITSAEDTLAENSGSPTAAMLALARARGLHASLILARTISTSRTDFPSIGVYDRPLIQLTFHHSNGRDQTVLLDLEDDDLPFGVIAPDIALTDALYVPTGNAINDGPSIIALDPIKHKEQNLAQGEMTISKNGDLEATVKIAFSDWESAELRSTASRKGSTSQLLDRIARHLFKDATDVSGNIRNEDDPEQPLTAEVRFTIPNFWEHPNESSRELVHFMAPLGLKETYAQAASRRSPLYLDSPENEAVVLHVHLPEHVQISKVPSQLDLNSRFGMFHLSLQLISENELEIKRSYSVPVQVVLPEDYGEFAEFAETIDRAQKGALLTSTAVTVASGKSN